MRETDSEPLTLGARLDEVFDTFAFGLELKRRSLRLAHPDWDSAHVEAELERWVRASDEP